MALVDADLERRARRHRLGIILVVGAILIGALFAFGAVRNRSLNSNTDSATAALHTEWRSLDLIGLADAYSQGARNADDFGDETTPSSLFPAAAHATFAGAEFLARGEVQANYSVHGWGGGAQCLTVTAKGPAPNNLTIEQDGVGC